MILGVNEGGKNFVIPDICDISQTGQPEEEGVSGTDGSTTCLADWSATSGVKAQPKRFDCWPSNHTYEPSSAT